MGAASPSLLVPAQVRLPPEVIEPTPDGIRVKVFEGSTADPMILAVQIDKLKGRFGLSRDGAYRGLCPA